MRGEILVCSLGQIVNICMSLKMINRVCGQDISQKSLCSQINAHTSKASSPNSKSITLNLMKAGQPTKHQEVISKCALKQQPPSRLKFRTSMLRTTLKRSQLGRWCTTLVRWHRQFYRQSCMPREMGSVRSFMQRWVTRIHGVWQVLTLNPWLWTLKGNGSIHSQ